MMTGYVYSLLKDISENYQGEELRTLYFGGGTPSLLPLDLLGKIIKQFKLQKDYELTIEVNPDSVNLEYLKGLRELGVNRLSIGSQTFDDNILKLIGRRHNSTQIVDAVDFAKEAGFDNISVDLIYGLPTQTMDGLQKDLEKFLSLDIQHISTYGLKIEEGCFWWEKFKTPPFTPPLPPPHPGRGNEDTPPPNPPSWIIRGTDEVTSDRHLTSSALFHSTENPLPQGEGEMLTPHPNPLLLGEGMSEAKFTCLPDDDEQADMYEGVNDVLESAGFYRYEVSNFAQKGFESRHNLNYWDNAEYYGFGAAAHGYVDGVRYSNFSTLEEYMEKPHIHEYSTTLTDQEKLEEEIFLGFRKRSGINVEEINEKFGIDFEVKYKDILEKYSDYIEKTPVGYTLNLKGVLISNIILAEFI